MSGSFADRPAQSLDDFVAARLLEFDLVDPARRAELVALADTIARRLASVGAVDLVFICTHNSRRSQFGQVWAAVAAERFGVAGLRSWSGGTEATRFEPRAIAALVRAGLRVEQESEAPNAVQLVDTGRGRGAIRCWSKRYDAAPNPSTGFVAVMTCSDADEACPAVRGALERLAIRYEDPKLHDGTSRETAAYDERCRQIAREMLFVFQRVAVQR